MTSISSVGGANSAWPDPGAARAAMKERLFAKVDADGSGSVDRTEMQSLVDRISEKTGQSVGNADELLTGMDSDGDGSLNSDELDAGMKSLLPPPSSTVDFAERHTKNGAAEGPPPGGAPAASSAASGTSSSTIDPLDTNEDGVVSAQERMAGELEALMTAMDSNGDKAVSADEVDSFISQLGDRMSEAYSRVASNDASTAAIDVAV